jgi:UPF0755 protein
VVVSSYSTPKPKGIDVPFSKRFELLMKKYFIFFVPSLVVVALAIWASIWWNRAIKPVSQVSTAKDFLIVKGSSAAEIGNKLYEEGLIRSSLAFRVYVQAYGKSKKIQAGEYSLSPNLSLSELVDLLGRGPLEVWVTIPEGLRQEEIAERFAVGLVKADAEVFIKEFLSSSKGKEGYLFPDTYLFPKTASASAVVNKLLTTFDQKTGQDIADGASENGLSLNEVVILASIIERETLGSEERPIVAGILYKRWENGWPLQADATLQYAVGTTRCSGQAIGCKWWEPVAKEDLNISSGYNSYKFTGLPPAPIANPGLSSLEAAANPQQNDYWYYIHDSTGQIHYAKTIEEHNANVAKYLGK